MERLPFCLLLSPFTCQLWAQAPAGVSFGLECLNDFFFTITCSLNGTNIEHSINTTDTISNMKAWLQAQDWEGENSSCELTRGVDSWGCALYTFVPGGFSFTDEDRYQISLFTSLHGNNSSVVLQPKYWPRNHIKPIPPANLSMQWVGEDAVFGWQSGYEPRSSVYEEHVRLIPNLKYQLLLVTTQGHREEIFTTNRNLSVAMSVFSPGSEYLATVRSQPNQIYYKGVWSQWAPILHWRTANHQDTSLPTGSVIFICLFLTLFLISYVLLVRWKKHAEIPHPVIYVTECGDFPGHACMVGIPLHEESLKIDTVTLQSIKAGINPYEQLLVTIGNKDQLNSFTGNAGCVLLDSMTTQMDRLHCSEDYSILTTLTP